MSMCYPLLIPTWYPLLGLDWISFLGEARCCVLSKKLGHQPRPSAPRIKSQDICGG